MSYPIETIDLSLVRHLSMRMNRINHRWSSLPSTLEECSVKYEKLVPDNLVEISEMECIEILNGNGVEAPKSLDENEDSHVVVVTAEQCDEYSWWSVICCCKRRDAATTDTTTTTTITTTTTPEAPPIEPVPEPKAEDVVVQVTDEMKKKKDLCVQTWIDLIEWEEKTAPPTTVEEIPVEPIKPDEEEKVETPVPTTPVPISRRGDLPMVVISLAKEKQPFPRGNHQYYRSSWRLKPSVIGAPETIGYEE